MYGIPAGVSPHVRSLSRPGGGETRNWAQSGCWRPLGRVSSRVGLSLGVLLSFASIAFAGGATIKHVALGGSTTRLVMTISGQGFGSFPHDLPCTSCAPRFLQISGTIGCEGNFDLAAWSDSNIIVRGIQGNPADYFFIKVTNPQNHTVSVADVQVPTTIKIVHPQITSVSFANIGENMRITVNGSGFGAAPSGVPGSVNLPYFSFVDRLLTATSWQAGYISPKDHSFNNAVTLNYMSWSPTKIAIAGFGARYGQEVWTVTSKDPVEIVVANTNSCGLGIDWHPAPYIPRAVWPVWVGRLP